jgi:hypothetical protein
MSSGGTSQSSMPRGGVPQSRDAIFALRPVRDEHRDLQKMIHVELPGPALVTLVDVHRPAPRPPSTVTQSFTDSSPSITPPISAASKPDLALGDYSRASCERPD